MLPKNVLVALVGAAVAVEASVLHFPAGSNKLVRRQNRGGNNNNNDNDDNNNDNDGQDQGLCLNADAVQTGSAQDGQDGEVTDGQSPSLTDEANFINFCSGKTLTNGQQVEDGSCNGVVMGEIPAKNRMISTVIVNPPTGEIVPANEDFDIELRTDNLDAGSFTEPQSTYYSAPQQLNGNGQVIGHTHVTVQDIGNSFNPQQPLDPTQFAFFKGINTAADGNGILRATVTGGLPAGNYRICTLTGASNHQPVLMPVAQRGSQDDCIRIEVGDANAGNDNGEADDENGADAGADEDQNNGNGEDQNNGNGEDQNNGNDEEQDEEDAAAEEEEDAGNDNEGGSQGGDGGAFADTALGGIAAPEVEDSGNDDRPFEVDGNTFVNRDNAVRRACDIQANLCADAANRGEIPGLSVDDCNGQRSLCVAELS